MSKYLFAVTNYSSDRDIVKIFFGKFVN